MEALQSFPAGKSGDAPVPDRFVLLEQCRNVFMGDCRGNPGKTGNVGKIDTL